MKKSFFPAEFQPFQRLADAALTASEPYRTLMLIVIGLLLAITDELVGINLGRGFVSSLEWFKPLRPAAHAGLADSETMGRLFGAIDQSMPSFRRKSLESAMCAV